MSFHSTQSVPLTPLPGGGGGFEKRNSSRSLTPHKSSSSSHTVKIQFDKNVIVVYFITNALREMYKNTIIGAARGG